MNSRDSLSFFAGLAFGAGLGAAFALLLAPQSGRKTRRRIRRWGEDFTDRVTDTVEELGTDARRVASDARRAAERSGERVSDTVSRVRDLR
jgi:gas vesicle protein